MKTVYCTLSTAHEHLSQFRASNLHHSNKTCSVTRKQHKQRLENDIKPKTQLINEITSILQGFKKISYTNIRLKYFVTAYTYLTIRNIIAELFTRFS